MRQCTVSLMIMLGLWAAGGVNAGLKEEAFFIRVVDEATGRGVPLVVLRTTNHLSWVTDSAGIAAIIEPGLMGQNVFFHVSSHGYTYPKDGFGYRGPRLDVRPGQWATIKVKRTNIAERLYRVTGEGIYHDSVLAGEKTPLANPVLNGQVAGQDSVQNCLYNGKLYWFWGDTGRPSYPLGHFAMAGAVSSLPGDGGLAPSVGVNLDYFVDASGFSRKMAPMDEPGMIWLDGVFAVKDAQGKMRMLAKYARMKSLGEAAERGFMVFDDDRQQFVPIVRGEHEFLLCADSGHPFAVDSAGEHYYYFAAPFPLGAVMRVKADWKSAIDPEAYEVFTAIDAGDKADGYRWVSTAKLLKTGKSSHDLIEAIRKERQANCLLYDVENGKKVTPHGGSIFWNAWRSKWVMITVQFGGEPSFLGEVWYAEADTPLGPWSYARRVVTHDRYSFYNPKHHPYFDEEGGSLIYFEGTYSHAFSGREEEATPRYDYNQIMYRLDLRDERLFLPGPVYETIAPDGTARYGTERQSGRKGTPAFYAMPPGRARQGLVAIYAVADSDDWRLVVKEMSAEEPPLFLALPATSAAEQGLTAPLYEYVHKTTHARRYGVQTPSGDGWVQSAAALCRVWKCPPVEPLADWQARPKTD